jgi:hypothetical protein
LFSFGVSVVPAYKSSVSEPCVNGATAATNHLCPSSGGHNDPPPFSPVPSGSSVPTSDRVSDHNGSCPTNGTSTGDQFQQKENKRYGPLIKRIDERLQQFNADVDAAANILGIKTSEVISRIRTNPILKEKWGAIIELARIDEISDYDAQLGLLRQLKAMDDELSEPGLSVKRKDTLRDTYARLHSINQRYEDLRIEQEKLA